MKKYLLLFLILIPLGLSAQRLGSFFHEKSSEVMTLAADGGTSGKEDDIKTLLAGIAPLTGATIIPTLNIEYDGKIGTQNNAISAQLFWGNDLDIDGDTLNSTQVRNALSKGFFIPEASNFRFNASWVYACKKFKTLKKGGKGSQTQVEKALFIGVSFDLVSKRVPVVDVVDTDTTWSKENFELAYITLTSQYRIAETNNQAFQISIYGDLSVAAIAGGREKVKNYYDSGQQSVHPSKSILIPKIGFETVFKNLVVDIGYIFKANRMEQYFQSNDPGFVTIKLGMNTKFKSN